MQLDRDPLLRRTFEDSFSRPNLGIERGFRTVSGVTSMEFARARRLRDAVGSERTWLLFQGRHMVADHRHTFKNYHPVRQLPLGIALFRHEGPLPEVLCTSQWASAPDLESAVSRVREGEVVEDVPAAPSGERIEPPCTLERLTPERWVLRLPPQPVPLLARISESYFPGWTATLPSGKRLAAHPVDVALLGLVVPPQTGSVELRFRPPWLNLLLAVSLGALLLTLFLVVTPLGKHAVAVE
jgi:hypothetical protein